jgi:hypothetical protein
MLFHSVEVHAFYSSTWEIWGCPSYTVRPCLKSTKNYLNWISPSSELVTQITNNKTKFTNKNCHVPKFSGMYVGWEHWIIIRPELFLINIELYFYNQIQQYKILVNS